MQIRILHNPAQSCIVVQNFCHEIDTKGVWGEVSLGKAGVPLAGAASARSRGEKAKRIKTTEIL